MKVIALQSGSNGNCIYVETKGVRLLFDAGISGTQAQTRLAAHGRDVLDAKRLPRLVGSRYEATDVLDV